MKKVFILIAILILISSCTIKMYTDVYITVEDMDVNIENFSEDEIADIFDLEDMY